MKPAVFLDRDGVINQLVSRDGGLYSPRRFEDFILFPFVKGALQQLRHEGFLVVIVTNQPDISRDAMDPLELKKMHDYLMKDLPIDAIYVCPHDNSNHCECRKPKPGMLNQAIQDLNIDTKLSWLIGDRPTDIEAGLAVGLSTILVDSGQTESRRSQSPEMRVMLTGDLEGAVRLILK